jgi:hypothetical protein
MTVTTDSGLLEKLRPDRNEQLRATQTRAGQQYDGEAGVMAWATVAGIAGRKPVTRPSQVQVGLRARRIPVRDGQLGVAVRPGVMSAGG